MSDPQIEPVPEGVPPPPPAPAGVSPAPRRTASPATIIVIALVLLAAALAAAWYWRGGIGSGADQAATAFFHANADQGSDAAYALTAPTFRDTTPAATWMRTSQSYRLGRMSGVDWTQRDAQGSVTTTRGTLHREGLPDLPVAVDLRRIDGQWKVATVVFETPAPLDPGAGIAAQPALPNAQPPAPAGDAPPATGADTPGPVMSVPRFGPAPDQGGAPAGTASASGAGRPGPVGSSVASGQVGPTCMGQLWKQGLRTTNVDCPLYLPARPGATEQCVARTQAGASTYVTVTYLDYDPITRMSAIDCHAN